mgnify:CR=1|jgi:hypothetical protein
MLTDTSYTVVVENIDRDLLRSQRNTLADIIHDLNRGEGAALHTLSQIFHTLDTIDALLGLQHLLDQVQDSIDS